MIIQKIHNGVLTEEREVVSSVSVGEMRAVPYGRKVRFTLIVPYRFS